MGSVYHQEFGEIFLSLKVITLSFLPLCPAVTSAPCNLVLNSPPIIVCQLISFHRVQPYRATAAPVL